MLFCTLYAHTLGYSEEQFIRFSLQFLVDRDELNIEVEVTPMAKIKSRSTSNKAA